jgi:hypothetical protein
MAKQKTEYRKSGTCPCGSHYAREHVSGYSKWLAYGDGRECKLLAYNLRYSELPMKAHKEIEADEKERAAYA